MIFSEFFYWVWINNCKFFYYRHM